MDVYIRPILEPHDEVPKRHSLEDLEHPNLETFAAQALVEGYSQNMTGAHSEDALSALTEKRFESVLTVFSEPKILKALAACLRDQLGDGSIHCVDATGAAACLNVRRLRLKPFLGQRSSGKLERARHTEDGDQKSEVRGQRSEDRGQTS
jgi:hypothetical protein